MNTTTHLRTLAGALLLTCAALLGACGGGEDEAPDTRVDTPTSPCAARPEVCR